MYSPSSDLAKQHIDLLLEEVEHDRLVGRARAARRRRRQRRAYAPDRLGLGHSSPCAGRQGPGNC
jgi:hypothetical protein